MNLYFFSWNLRKKKEQVMFNLYAILMMGVGLETVLKIIL